MKNMKKMIALLLLAVFFCSATACGSSEMDAAQKEDALKDDGMVGATGEEMKDEMEDSMNNAGDMVEDNGESEKK